MYYTKFFVMSNRKLCRLYSLSGCFGKEKNLFPLPKTEYRIVQPAAQSLYRHYTTLHWLLYAKLIDMVVKDEGKETTGET